MASDLQWIFAENLSSLIKGEREMSLFGILSVFFIWAVVFVFDRSLLKYFLEIDEKGGNKK